MTEINLTTFSMREKPPAAGADWFRIVKSKAAAEPTKVYIYDEIGFWGTTAKDFVAVLNEIDSDSIELHLNTPGGSVFDGLAISAALKSHKATVTAMVDGMAASAGSFILQAADERLMTRNAQVMIHDAKAYAGGNAQQMRKAADLLDRISDNIADIYAVRSGQGTVESWRAIMTSGDTWYNGNEAVEAGLVDSVVDNPEEDDNAPEEATKNSWSSKEIEAFLNTSPEKLAASAALTNTHRVEEKEMADPSPNTPPPAAQPPVQNNVTAAPPAPAPAPAPAAPTNLSLMVNGVEVTDLAAVQAHITGLESFKKETIEAGRKSFVEKLVNDGKIAASKENVEATEAFALSLSSEQFTAWKNSMESAQPSNLFGAHGTSQGDKNAPQNGSRKDAETAAQIKTYEEIVQSHRDAGLSEEEIQKKDSYKQLQNLKSTQSSAS